MNFIQPVLSYNKPRTSQHVLEKKKMHLLSLPRHLEYEQN